VKDRLMLGKLWNLLPSETLHGYEHPELIETIFRKTIAYKPIKPWPEMANANTVLDFGGGCGIHYKQANHQTVRWAVVETPAMVKRAKILETYHLKFFTDINEAASWLGPIDVMHSNGAVQYADDPLSTVVALCALKAQRMLWYRLFLGDGAEVQVSRLQDNGPGKLATPRKKVAYPFKRIQKSDFLSAHDGYRVVESGEDWFQFAR
jgi:putative methyltransferase (TIGR04325 family)